MQSRTPESHWPLTILLGLSSLSNLFLPLILVRLLPAEQVGFYKIFFLYSATAPWLLFASGFSKGLYFWGAHWRGDKESRHQAFSATWSFQIYWSIGLLTLALICFPFFKYIPSFLFSDSLYISLLIFSVALAIPASFYEECRIARGENKIAGIYSAFWEMIRTASLIASAIYFKSIGAVLIANTVIVGLKLLLSSYFVLAYQFATFSLKQNLQSKSVWNYAFPLSGAAALAVVFSYGDQFILGYYLSASDFALYSLGCLSVPPLFIFEQSVNKVMLPHLTKAMSEDISTAWKNVRFAIMDLGLWLVPSGVGLFFFAGPITRLLFTDKYPQTEYFLMLYSFFYLFFIIPYDAWERAQGRSAWILKTTAFFAGISILSTWAGAKYFNAYIALGSYLFWQLGVRLYSLYTMKKRLGWDLHKILPGYSLARAFSVSVILGLITRWLVKKQTEIFGHETLAMFIWGLAFWIAYVILCVPWTLKKERMEKNTKKVLILTQYLNIGGLERMIYNLSKGLKKQGEWTPSVFVYDHIPGVATMDETFNDIKVYRHNKKAGFSFKTVLQIIRVCRQEDIGQIHAHDLGALIYAVFAKWFSFGRVRVIYTLHSFVHLNKKARHKSYEKIFCLFADSVTTVSGQLQTIFDDLGIAKGKVKVIENGVPFSDRLKSSDEKKNLKAKLIPGKENLYWVLCLARLHPGKGQLEAINIWNHLSAEIREKSLLVFVGGETEIGYTKIIEAAKTAANNSENIYLAGSTLEPTPWLQATDLLLSASLQEGLPLAPLEGLALEIPVVLSDIPGHSMFKGITQLFPVDDFSKAAQILTSIISSREIYKKPESLLHRFSVERMTNDYIETYTEYKA